MKSYRLRGWVKKGKAWAMSILAQRYIQGVVVKQSDKKAIELLEMAALSIPFAPY